MTVVMKRSVSKRMMTVGRMSRMSRQVVGLFSWTVWSVLSVTELGSWSHYLSRAYKISDLTRPVSRSIVSNV